MDALRRRLALALRGEVDGSRGALAACRARLPLALRAQTVKKRAYLGRLSAGLDALSPLKVLGRGYAIARRGEDVVSAAAQVEAGDRLDVLVADGVLNCVVEGKDRKSTRLNSSHM